MKNGSSANLRILLVDDNPAIHDDFRRILTPESCPSALDEEATALFDAPPKATLVNTGFELESAHQGQEARNMTIAACQAGRPYALAFVDMRMPPGWDGLMTIGKLWEVDPELNVVICTAHSDHSWEEIQAALPVRERWLVLKKPFDKIEVLQLAHALTEKWNVTRMANAQRATLERMVEGRTAELRRALQVKNEFLANVTHELLTPMNGVLGMLALLAEGGVDASGRECLNDARQSGENLLRLLQQILAFNQAEAGTLSIDPVDFQPGVLVEEALLLYRLRAEQKGLQLRIELDPELPAEVCAPVPVIRQILLALIDNAVKFTSSGSVTVHVRGAPDSRLAFAVRDTGIGLSPEQLEWIALPFAQVDGGRNRRTSGIGIGLPLAKRLAAALGGELTLETRPGGGTTAEFSVLISSAVLSDAGK